MMFDMPPQAPPAGLAEIQAMEQAAVEEGGDLGRMRQKILWEAASDLAMRRAIAWRYNTILTRIDGDGRVVRLMDRIFDFSLVATPDKRMLYPVIVRADDARKRHGLARLSESHVTYRIERDAELVAALPSWRDYLMVDYQAPGDISPALLPKSEAEKAVWKAGAEAGWKLGVDQANELYELNLSRLVRDFRGRLAFRLLSQQGLVSLPDYRAVDHGIVVGDRSLSIGQREFTIENPSSFESIDQWEPIISIQKNP